MAPLHQYDYIFAITTVFAFLDAWNIGANDVANSFATSVSSRSLTLKQAMGLAAVMEFSGSISVGSRVADTIRTHVIDETLYASDPGVLLLAMMCAIVGSSVFLTFATHYGFPVSTTHSIIGGFVGAGTASIGITKINWGWNGVSQVFAAWVIAPGIAGIVAAVLFLITKYAVLLRKEAARKALASIPVYTFLTVAALAMLVAWKGVQLDVDLDTKTILISVFATAAGATVLQAFFVLPFLWCRVIREDWQLKWYDAFQGPLLLRRPPAPPPPAGISKINIKDYYHGYLSLDELECIRQSDQLMESVQNSPTQDELFRKSEDIGVGLNERPTTANTPLHEERRKPDENATLPPRPPGPWNSMPVFIWRLNRILLRGVEKDVVNFQKRLGSISSIANSSATNVLNLRIEDIHARCPRFDNRAEYMYSALQVLTAATSSFIHGANDVANCVAPFTSAYSLWRHGEVRTEYDVPLWILCFGGGAIVLGLGTPSRGFCMELGSAVTVLMATRWKLPVSTTQCIAGATVGVGLANGDWRAVNKSGD
ncbi:Phosphate-repressible phosphate permease pho-4 [Zalerion maritima]|uniref:Phosphate transporter n=1 Tax=Zalerion maritima TaxID=339359 RepID=A0AAD5RM90_9PEZI|nr:Phosphate-repressible phosphate permease pho-4 [Zalerion maritima]